MSTAIPIERVDPGALRVLRRLRGAGHRAVLAGGCVRDLLLGRPPADWDVATDADPPQVMALFARTVPIGARFGIVRVVDDVGGGEYQVARFRREGPYSDGRHPDDVAFSTPEEDARRRDFTINGMFLDIDGEVIDYVGGRRDLAAGVVRAIGDPAARFAEDALRTLRAIRFAARLGFRIDAGTWDALRAAAAGIERISAERVRDELTQILTEGGAARALDLLRGSGLLPRVLPEVAAMEGVAQPPEHHPEGDVWEHVRRMLALIDALDERSATLAWGALLHDVGKPATFSVSDRIRFSGHDALGAQMVDAIARRLRFGNRDRERVRDLTAHHMRFRNVRQMRPSKLKRFLREDYFPELLELHRIDCQASHGLLDLYEFCREALRQVDAEGRADGLRPAPLLTGDDLIALGYEPGPRFGQILAWVEDEQLDGRLTSPEQARAAVRERWGRAGGDDL